MIAFAGPVKLYFNRHTTDDLVWIVWHGGVEVAVRELVVLGVTLRSVYKPQPVIEGERRHDGPPSAYFEGEATVAIGPDGVAMITPV